MGRVQGKVALITGAARGQGRNHAVRLAEQGADIIAIDACVDYDTMNYPMGTEDDLAETAALIEKLDRRVVTAKADIRDLDALTAAVDQGVAELGKLDIVSANAGICSIQDWDEVTPQLWKDTIDVLLTGTWHTCKATIPHLVANGGGSIIVTGSTSAMKGQPFLTPYVAAKHGCLGLVQTLANELSLQKVRVNLLNPTGVDTPLLAGFGGLPGLLERNPHQAPCFINALEVEFVDPDDITHALMYLASDESRYVTGTAFNVDAGNLGR
jgi:SDR family mycofactocin-dependent oxidoreductase